MVPGPHLLPQDALSTASVGARLCAPRGLPSEKRRSDGRPVREAWKDASGARTGRCTCRRARDDHVGRAVAPTAPIG